MTETQSKLENLYTDYLKVILSDKELYEKVLNFNISSPIFLNCNAEFAKYIESDFKILYVGQETNYWFNSKERADKDLLHEIRNSKQYINGLTELYNDFNLGHNYKKAIFTFMDILVDKLRKQNYMTGILWTNLLRHDGYNGKVPLEVEKKITYNKNYIFRKELEILKPDAVIFATGPNYDYIIEKSYSGLEKIKATDESERKICMLKHKDLPEKSVRVYHPNAHKYQGGDYRWELADKIIGLIS